MKKKIMLSTLLVLIFGITLMTILVRFIVNYQFEENIKQNLSENNNIVMNMIYSNNIKDMSLLFKQNFKDSNVRFTYINKDGKVIEDSVSDEETMSNHNDRPEIIDARKNKIGFSKRYSLTLQKDMIYCATLINNRYIIRSSLPVVEIQAFEGNYLKYFLFVILLVSILSLLISSKLSYLIIKPIKHLEYVTSQFAKGNLDNRIKVLYNDEVGQLSNTFNDMADKLQATINDAVDNQNKLQAILKSMDSGVVAIDRNNKVIMINPSAEKIFGIKTNIIGENLLDKIRDFEFEGIFLNKNNDDYNEIKIFNPKERELRIRTAEIVNGNEIIGKVAVIIDISDVKKLENVRSQFVANVSHELKTPLTSIKGFSETLKYVDDFKTRERFLDIINTEADRLTRLINDILTLSSIESNIEPKLKNKINPNSIISNVFNLMKNTAEAKDIVISIEGGDLPCIYGDEDRFKQMLINLIDNAIKYSESGNKVIINKYVQNNNCVIYVKDEGIGIPKDNINRLFERFYRVDKARSRAQGGTGLGLAIVKHIVISFNGRIDVESEIGKGSKFIITIPINA